MGSIDHDMFVNPEDAIATLFDAADMGDKLVRCYEPNSKPQYMLEYATQLEQCVRFAIPKILVRIAAEDQEFDAAVETTVALAKEDTRLEEALSSDDEPILLKRKVLKARLMKNNQAVAAAAVVLEEPVVPVEVRRSMRLRK